MPARVHVRRIGAEDEALARAVRGLRLGAGQCRYVGDLAFNLGDSLRDPHSEAMAVLAGDAVAGFYRLDFSPRGIAGRDFPEPSVGLRSFAIDRAWQGRGCGAAALSACCADLRARHPRRRLLALTVNCENAPALALYRKAGFVVVGEPYLGGGAGPQHVMLYRLQPQAPTAGTP
ncbi:GNAT family N-acetyltransferase [Vulcaniibacterium tengchongense]|uniref:GNAT family N-acetyltransferase n=1 Tax=Vulcaniibacterium tengchongense TaxID=1273429 RepID=UPI001315A552|nr:N-acetyltransferase [Vulcaniibacterium tengchongense]